MKLFALLAIAIFSSTAEAARDRQFVCTDPAGTAEETFFFSIDSRGARLTDIHAEGPNGFEIEKKDIVQFKYESEANESKIFIRHQGDSMPSIGFILEVSGNEAFAAVLTGRFRQVTMFEDGSLDTILDQSVRCRRYL